MDCARHSACRFKANQLHTHAAARHANECAQRDGTVQQARNAASGAIGISLIQKAFSPMGNSRNFVVKNPQK